MRNINWLPWSDPGSTVHGQHQQLLDLRYTLKTGGDGTVRLDDINEGRYSYNVNAPGCVPFSGTFVVEPGMTTTIPLALEVNMVEIEWSVVPTTIIDHYEIKITQTFETNVPAPVLITEPGGITLPEMLPGEVLNGEFTVTNYGMVEVYDVHPSFPTSFGDYDIEVMVEAIPDKLAAMQTIRVPYRVTRRVQASANTCLFDEVSGFGGGNCGGTATIKIPGAYVICPNTPAQRIGVKWTHFYISVYSPCDPGSPPWLGGAGGGSSSGGTSGGGGQGSGGATPSQPTPITTGDPCECMNCDDNNACTVDSCSGGVCINEPVVCDDGNVCTTDSCDAGSGECKYLPVSDGPITPDDSTDCFDKECINGEIISNPDDSETPANECEFCQNGPQTRPDGPILPDDQTDCVDKVCTGGQLSSTPDLDESPTCTDCAFEIDAKANGKDEAIVLVNKSVSFVGLGNKTGSGDCTFVWNWDFGDGQTSSNQNDSHTYSELGEYTVTLSATCEGCEAKKNQDTVKVTVVDVAAADYLVPGHPQNQVVLIVPSSIGSPSTFSLNVKDNSGALVRSVSDLLSTSSSEMVNGAVRITGRWNAMIDDAGSAPLAEAQAPYSMEISADIGGASLDDASLTAKLEERPAFLVVSDKPATGQFATGIDKTTLVAGRISVSWGFEGYESQAVDIAAFAPITFKDKPDGPAGNGWDAHVALKDSVDTNYLLYTTPTDPWTIKYKIVIQSIGEKVRDNVLNEWDMDPDTPDKIEEKGTLVFEVKPKGTAGDDFIHLDTSATKYEEIQ